IVPIKTIEKKYPGGWEKCLHDHAKYVGGVWHDDHLFRAGGAMNEMDMISMVWQWKNFGFRTHKGGKKPNTWIDVCVVGRFGNEPTLPCDWIEVEDGTAFLKGTPKGEAVGPQW
ncbi:MAG: hypothetical protein R8J85_02005, partial [Mariprofundales bacterium]